MTGMQFDLDWLLSPLSGDEFFESHWEKEPLILRREQPDYYRDLLSLTDLDQIVTGNGIRFPTLQLIKDGQRFQKHEYLYDIPYGKDTFEGVIDPHQVLSAYADGTTLLLHALHIWWPQVIALSRNLEKAFSQPITANVYFTPEESQGLPAHYDRHDVFVIQVAGAKHWRIYGPRAEFPFEVGAYDTSLIHQDELLHKIDLEMGDLIYLPRGFTHDVRTIDSFSAHITVGVVGYTWYHLLARTLEKVALEDGRFRQMLPRGYVEDPNAADKLADTFAELLQGFAEQADLAYGLERVSRSFLTDQQPQVMGYFAAVEALESISADTLLRRRRETLARLVEEDGKLALYFSGHKDSFPKHLREPLEFILYVERFTPDDLPGGLFPPEKIMIVKRLVKQGFLEFDT